MNILKIVLIVFFCLFSFVIVWAMFGYKISLKILRKLVKTHELKRDFNDKPTVSVMIVAHNEEDVILTKLQNVINNDYPKDKIDYIITSDYSTDKTNSIVEEFIADHPNINIRLHKTVEHKGKTNAQNEAQKLTNGKILVMTDANAMFESNAISELVSSFSSSDIAYVCGRLVYRNKENQTAAAESAYWEGDLAQRKIESDIRTITAGNGAIYACRNNLYYDFNPRYGHDAQMPRYFAMKGMRAIYNPNAVAYEKAGEVLEDEFKRKVRMNRNIVKGIFRAIPCLNFFKYGWFSYFYFGHRFCRVILWLSHLIIYVCSAILSFYSLFFGIVFAGQTLFFIISMIAIITKTSFKPMKMMGYYAMTIAAQWVAVFRCITGKSKPTWDKAESTR